MIVSKLQGGLANQIFQWAYARSLSEKYNTSLYLDVRSYIHQSGITNRNFSLECFPNIKYDIIPTEPNISLWNNENKGVITNLSDNFVYKDEKYFIEHESIIKQELSPSDEDLIRLKDMIPSESVSLHIRRTDYVTSNGFHPVQTVEYYEKALSLIGDYKNIVVFSDDISWCKENLKFDNTTFIEGNKDYEDLWLMSLCDHNIIANSSFSWWGAWLNNNVNKKVVAPSNWFGQQANTNTSDIIPESWIKL
jgi:hypothetical protein